MEYYIPLSLAKSKYVIFLVSQYQKIGFKDFDLIELAELSKSQWKNKCFLVPEGFRIKPQSNSNILEKIPKEVLMKNKILGSK